MSKKPVSHAAFAIGDKIIVTDDNSPYVTKAGYVIRLGSAGDDVIYIHAQLIGIPTVITFRTFQIQKS